MATFDQLQSHNRLSIISIYLIHILYYLTCRKVWDETLIFIFDFKGHMTSLTFMFGFMAAKKYNLNIHDWF